MFAFTTIGFVYKALYYYEGIFSTIMILIMIHQYATLLIFGNYCREQENIISISQMCTNIQEYIYMHKASATTDKVVLLSLLYRQTVKHALCVYFLPALSLSLFLSF